MIKKLFIALLSISAGAFFTPIPLRAQSLATGLTSVLHPSPTAASLGKFTELPVSLHTGVPSITVPIWQIQRGDIQLPISLDYHSGGIRVDEIASWVGIGWALSAGGMITRSARGLPDNLDQYPTVELPRLQRFLGLAGSPMSATERHDFVVNVYSGVYDAEPDLYSLSVGGIACQFFLNKSGEFVTTSRALNLKIAYQALDMHGKRFTWLVTNGKGVQYKFLLPEHTTTTAYSFDKAGASSTTGSSFDGDVSWGLQEIEDTQGNVVKFTYAQDGNSFANLTNEFRTTVDGVGDVQCLGKSDQGYTYVDNEGTSLRLTAITCGQEEIRFLADPAERQDVAYAHALKRIEVAYAGVTKHAFQFYEKTVSASSIGTGGVYYHNPHQESRLQLDSLREESPDGSLVLPAYRFTYNPGQLPFRGSAAQDYWGFYNGQDNQSRVSYTQAGYRLGAKKDPSPAAALIGTLAAIQYPTGGKTSFTYESNRYRTTTPLPLDTVFAKAEVNTYLGVPDYGFSAENTFEITADMVAAGASTVMVKFNMNLLVDGAPITQASGFTQYAIFYKVDDRNALIPNSFEEKYGRVFFCTPGKYKMELYIEKEFCWPQDARIIHLDASISADITASPFAVNKEYCGPGLRIKEIRKEFGVGPVEVSSYTYTDPQTGKTSGLLGNLPDYQRDKVVRFVWDDPDSPSVTSMGQYFCNCHNFSSDSHYPLINTRGSYVGYSYVTEYVDRDRQQGYKQYAYTNFDSYNDLNATSPFPYPPATSQEWKRGLPVLEQTYAGLGPSSRAGTSLLQADSTTYSAPTSSLDWAYGLKLGNDVDFGNLLSGKDVEIKGDTYSKLRQIPYRLETDSFQPETKVSTHFGQTKTWQTRTSYLYTSDTFQPAQVTTTTSDGATLAQHFYYPTTYRALAGSSPVLMGLLAANRVSVPIESSTWRQTTTTAKLVASVAHEYGLLAATDGSQRFFLRKIYAANTAQADTGSHYTFQSLPAAYEEKAFTAKITSHGQPLLQKTKRTLLSSYHWGYEDRYPVAECQNATDTEFFYESFEEANGATVGLAHSGNQYVAGTYTLRWTPPSARAYVVRYWARHNGQWQQQQTPYAGPSLVLTGGDAYDDVSVYPADAQLICYTYQPLIGMTSQTDPTGRTITYEYDALGRLIRTRDEQGRILSQQQYHYGN